MNPFQRFLFNLKGALADERQQAKEASFFELALTFERMVKRSLQTQELLTLWDMDSEQTEVITNLLKEANKG